MNLSLYSVTQKDASHIVGWRHGVPVLRDEFVARMSGWSALLSSLSGQDYALFIDDSIEFCAALLGAWQAGKTVWLSADTLEPSCLALAGKVDGFIGEFPASCQPLMLPTHAVDRVWTLNPVSENDVVLVVQTSGTTGAPQSIPKKLSQLRAEIDTLEQLFGSRCGHAEIISTVSHHHIYGLLFKVLWPIAFGRSFHAHTLKYPEQIAQLLLTRDCILIASPAHLKRLPDHLTWAKEHVHAVFCSGGVLPADAALSCSVLLGKTPVEVYGSSETGGMAWRERGDTSDESWQPMPGVAWRVSPGDDLIEVKSPHLVNDQWLKTSDRIQKVGQDRFLLTGRQDRIVKIEEKRISIESVEQCLRSSALVSDVKLVFINDDQTPLRRQHLAAVVQLTATGKQFSGDHGKAALSRQLRSLLKHQIEPVAIPRRWRYVDHFPVNEQGKTPVTLLEALFLGERGKKSSGPVVSLLLNEDFHARFNVYWPSDFSCFEGHFPDAPVLPGVAQVHWAIRIARQIFDLPAFFCAMRALKFYHVIRPDSMTTLTLYYDTEKESLTFSYFAAGRTLSGGRICFAQKNEGAAGA